MVADEILYQTSCRGHIIILVCGHHILDQRVEQRNNPPVYLRALRHRYHRSIDVETVYIGIKGEERIGIVKGSEELPPHLIHPGLIELQVIPRLGIGQHIPPERIRAVFVQSLERIHGIPETLAHLVPVLVEDKAVGNDAPEGACAADHRMYGMKGIEPAPCLVHSLGYEVGRASEFRRTEIAESFLCIRHGPGIEPHIDQVRLADHLLSASGHKEYVVHIRSVQVYPVIVLL